MTSVARWVEVHRLAVAGREAGIARDVGNRVGRVWLATSRFTDVARLAELTLTLGADAGAFYDLGWAMNATGDRTAALAAYDQALSLYRAAGERGSEAATLSNIGHLYDSLGERQRALEYYGQALPMMREVGDRAGEAVTRYNMAMTHRAQGTSRGRLPSWSRSSNWTARSATPTCNPTPKCSSKSARSWRNPTATPGHHDIHDAVRGGATAGSGRHPDVGGTSNRGAPVPSLFRQFELYYDV